MAQLVSHPFREHCVPLPSHTGRYLPSAEYGGTLRSSDEAGPLGLEHKSIPPSNFSCYASTPSHADTQALQASGLGAAAKELLQRVAAAGLYPLHHLVAPLPPTPDFPAQRARHQITSMAFHPHLPYLAIVVQVGASSLSHIRFYNTQSAQLLEYHLSHSFQVDVGDIAWKPGSFGCLAVGVRGGVLVWKLDESLFNPAPSSAPDSTSRSIVQRGRGERSLEKLDVNSGTASFYPFVHGTDVVVDSLVFSHDEGTHFISASSQSGKVRVFDVAKPPCDATVQDLYSTLGGTKRLGVAHDNTALLRVYTHAPYIELYNTESWHCTTYRAKEHVADAQWVATADHADYRDHAAAALFLAMSTVTAASITILRVETMGTKSFTGFRLAAHMTIVTSPYRATPSQQLVGGAVRRLWVDGTGHRMVALLSDGSMPSYNIRCCDELRHHQVLHVGFLHGPSGAKDAPSCAVFAPRSFRGNLGALFAVATATHGVDILPMHFSSSLLQHSLDG